MKTGVAIVDDNKRNRQSLAEQMRFSEEINVVLQAKDGADFLDQLKHLKPGEQPQIVLMDIDMPGMNGIQTVQVAHQLYPEMRFLMLTVFDDDDKIFEAIRSGANGYLLKDEKTSTIIDYIQQLIEIGGAPMSPAIARKALQLLSSASIPHHPPQAGQDLQSLLSERETEVLKLMVAGHDYKTIAAKLFLSTHTIRKHIANIYEKLHVNSKAQIITLAHKNKWVN